MEPGVSVIIPTKNGIGRIERCLNSIEKQSYKNFEIYVLDDGSDDGTPEFIGKKFPKVRVMILRKGLAENRNIGVYSSRGKYVVMIDDDAYLDQNWIKVMKKFMDNNPNIAIAGGKIFLDNRRLFSAGVRISKMGNGYDIGYGEPPDKYNELRKCHYMNTTALIARKKMIEKVGVFDKMHWFGYEDMDLGWKCNIAGYDVVYYPKALAYHPPKKLMCREDDPFWRTYVWKKTKVLTFLKNYEPLTLLKLSPLFICIFLYNLVLKQDRIQTIKAYLWSLFHISHIMKERKKIKKIRKRSDKELFEMLDWSFI